MQWNMARAAAAADAWTRRQNMLDVRATRTSETRSCPGSRPRCSSGRPRCTKGSAAVRRFAPRWSATPAPRPGRCDRSRGSTRWWAASSSPGSSSPRQTGSSRSWADPILLGFGYRRDRRAPGRRSRRRRRAPPRRIPRTREVGDRAFRPTTAAHLAEALYAQGRDEDAGNSRRSASSSPPGTTSSRRSSGEECGRRSWRGRVASTRPKASHGRR